jgi:hypothetical protein
MSFWNRESKAAQGGLDVSVKELFRLEGRTIASRSSNLQSCSSQV